MTKQRPEDSYQELLVHDEPISRGIAVSIGVHVFILAAFTVKAFFFTPPSIDFSQAVRVDIVGLPQKLDPNTILDNPAPNPEVKPEPTPKSEPQVESTKPEPLPQKPEPKAIAEKTKTPKADPDSVKIEKSTKQKQSSAIAKLKAMEALEKLKNEVKQEAKKTSGTGSAKNASPLIRGNILSPGTALTGLSKLQHDAYISDLDKHIKNHWTLPEWLSTKDYKAQVRVYIDSRGMLVKKVLVKSSGNPTYDDYALETIDKSIPFPAPPEKLTAILEVNGFVVGFPD